ncbi:MAG: hypothetical protein AAF802_19405 [Planctomycetota bacterium]
MKIRSNQTLRATHSLVFILGFATAGSTAFADTTSIIDRAGRLLGFGWGDGYHACRDGGCRPGADLPPGSYVQQFGSAKRRDIGHGGIYPSQTALPKRLQHLRSDCDSPLQHHLFDRGHSLDGGSSSVLMHAPVAPSVPFQNRAMSPSLPMVPSEPLPYAEPIERPSISDDTSLMPIDELGPEPNAVDAPDADAIADDVVDDLLPPAWEDESYEQATPKALPNVEEIAPSETFEPETIFEPQTTQREAPSPSDQGSSLLPEETLMPSNELLPDNSLLPAPMKEDDSLLLDENEVELIPDGPSLDDELLPKDELVRPPFVEQLPTPPGAKLDSTALPRGYGNVVRINPYVRGSKVTTARKGIRTVQPSSTLKSVPPRTKARPTAIRSTASPERRQWSPVKQPDSAIRSAEPTSR